MVILMDRERRIRIANPAALEFAGHPSETMSGLRIGEALHCLYALDHPMGCEHGSFCETCPMRRILLETFEKGKSHNQVEIKLPLSRGNKHEEIHLLVSTAPVSVVISLRR